MKGHTNNPNGRPAMPKGKQRKLMSVRIDPDTFDWIDEQCRMRHMSKGKFIDLLKFLTEEQLYD